MVEMVVAVVDAMLAAVVLVEVDVESVLDEELGVCGEFGTDSGERNLAAGRWVSRNIR